MTYLNITENCDLYIKVISLIEGITGERPMLDFSGGRPVIYQPCGDIADLNISHSADLAAIALADCRVGVDMEVILGREHASVLSRLSERERAEISCESDFFVNWTAKEAFIKMHGFTLATHYKRLEFYGGNIYLDGERQVCFLRHIKRQNAIICVCLERPSTQFVLL